MENSMNKCMELEKSIEYLRKVIEDWLEDKLVSSRVVEIKSGGTEYEGLEYKIKDQGLCLTSEDF